MNRFIYERNHYFSRRHRAGTSQMAATRAGWPNRESLNARNLPTTIAIWAAD